MAYLRPPMEILLRLFLARPGSGASVVLGIRREAPTCRRNSQVGGTSGDQSCANPVSSTGAHSANAASVIVKITGDKDLVRVAQGSPTIIDLIGSSPRSPESA
jgi:hypothetical protein